MGDSMEPRQKGTVARWMGRKGYGFIKPDNSDENTKDIFFHVSQLQCAKDKAVKNVARDENVEYQLSQDGQKRECAINITGPDGADVKGYELKPREKRPKAKAADDDDKKDATEGEKKEKGPRPLPYSAEPKEGEWTENYSVGRIVRWMRGYGFIRPRGASDDQEKDIFLHSSEITGHRLGLRGAWVEYKEAKDDDGRSKAVGARAPGGESLKAPRRPRRRARNKRKKNDKEAPAENGNKTGRKKGKSSRRKRKRGPRKNGEPKKATEGGDDAKAADPTPAKDAAPAATTETAPVTTETNTAAATTADATE